MVSSNAGHELYGHFLSRHNEKYDTPFRGSRYRDAAMLRRVADDIGVDTLRELIDYYFEHKSNNDFTHFIFNYDKLMDDKEMSERDSKEREKLRERTRQRLEELGVDLNSEV